MPRPHPTYPPSGPSLEEAHRLLGLRPGATADQVRAAYRRKVAALHPDRFHHLGPDAVARAVAPFRAVVAAHRLLLAASAHRPTARLDGGVYRPRAGAAAATYSSAYRSTGTGPGAVGARVDLAA